jgi:hypothetical protein
MAAPGDAGGPGRQHLHPDHFLAFARKQAKELGQDGRNYVERCAEMIRRDFPGSADAMLPELRKIWLTAEPRR